MPADLFYSKAMIDEYDKVVGQLATRAESLTDFDGTFVETIFPEVMLARQHQIIYGRRGAGKTHLLRRVESRLTKTFTEHHILPIYINGSQLSEEIRVVSSDPSTTALAIYVQLMQHIGASIREFVNALHQANFWDRVVGGGKSQPGRTANAISTLLESVLTSGQVRLLPAGEVSDEATTLAETSRNTSMGASVKVNPSSIGWAVQAGTAAENSAKTTSVITTKIHGEVILPFAQVSQQLARLMGLLDNADIYILFDEWSEVDKDPQVQPYLAEMLRRTTSAVPGIYLKLACIPGRTHLATPITERVMNPIGLEEGDDISADVNLDEVVFAKESVGELAPFFMAMIKKHVEDKIEWVRHSSKVSFERFLTTMIFSDLQTFVELCQASGGVPRDFMSIYRNATIDASNRAKSAKEREPFSLPTVRMAAKKVYLSKRESFAGKSSSPQLTLLSKIYQNIYVKKRSYYFLLSEESAENDIMQALYTEKLIHRIPATYYDPNAERTYQYFQLDYGITLDRIMSNAANDAIASYQSSVWVKMGERGSKFLGRALSEQRSPQEHVVEAIVTALFMAEPGRLDIEPREIIFSPVEKAANSSRNRGRHRR